MNQPERSITLEEWESTRLLAREIEVVTGCDIEVAVARLGQLVRCSPAWGGAVELVASGKVGEISIGGLHVRVRPHLPAGDLVRLFAWVRGARLDVLDEMLGVHGQADVTFIEALAVGLVVKGERLLLRDPDRAYWRREERLALLRGRPVFEKMGAAPLALGVPCRYMEGTRDTPPNRLVAFGLDAATRVLRRQGAWIGRARAVAQVFLDLAPGARMPSRSDYIATRERLSQRSEPYREALWLSEWLVLGGGPLSSAGAGGTAGWSLDMAALFEAAVTQALRKEVESLGLRAVAQKQDRRAITTADGAEYCRVIPDIEVLRGEQVIAVVDAKYKAYCLADDDGSPSLRIANGDLYQLAFYGSRGPGPVMLAIVSPQEGEAPSLDQRFRTIHVAGQPLRLIGVDLGALAGERHSIWSQIEGASPPAPTA
ncbi:5-methylcytosine restriction system specificity protein McrC [Sorangium sp. So ce1099]|uniref:5-methylcytosine restriction system specificity protein McrC n=1 Tax=Sorangium sp. So ce1099 TaxID=3133331 RepID=UPI003F62BF89